MDTHCADWTAKKQRRVALINQKYDQGLSQKEEAELEQLQEEMDRYLET